MQSDKYLSLKEINTGNDKFHAESNFKYLGYTIG